MRSPFLLLVQLVPAAIAAALLAAIAAALLAMLVVRAFQGVSL